MNRITMVYCLQSNYEGRGICQNYQSVLFWNGFLFPMIFYVFVIELSLTCWELFPNDIISICLLFHTGIKWLFNREQGSVLWNISSNSDSEYFCSHVELLETVTAIGILEYWNIHIKCLGKICFASLGYSRA